MIGSSTSQATVFLNRLTCDAVVLKARNGLAAIGVDLPGQLRQRKLYSFLPQLFARRAILRWHARRFRKPLVAYVPLLYQRLHARVFLLQTFDVFHLVLKSCSCAKASQIVHTTPFGMKSLCVFAAENSASVCFSAKPLCTSQQRSPSWLSWSVR